MKYRHVLKQCHSVSTHVPSVCHYVMTQVRNLCSFVSGRLSTSISLVHFLTTETRYMNNQRIRIRKYLCSNVTASLFQTNNIGRLIKQTNKNMKDSIKKVLELPRSRRTIKECVPNDQPYENAFVTHS